MFISFPFKFMEGIYYIILQHNKNTFQNLAISDMLRVTHVCLAAVRSGFVYNMMSSLSER